MKNLFCLGFIIILLVACQQNNSSDTSEEPPALDLTSTLPGTWELVSIKVNVNSYENTDSSFVQEITEEQWEKIFYVKPARTYFELDNKYRRAHIDMGENVMSEARGMWNVFNDTLMMIEPDATYQYIVRQQPNGLLQFSAVLDWDSDGQEDDEYLGIQRYISRTTE